METYFALCVKCGEWKRVFPPSGLCKACGGDFVKDCAECHKHRVIVDGQPAKCVQGLQPPEKGHSCPEWEPWPEYPFGRE